MDTRTLARGLAAGAAGTAAMTAYQKLVLRSSGEPAPTWEQAPPQTRIARRALGVVGVDLSARRIPLVSSIVHWTYGTALGPAYALLDERADRAAAAEGAGFGAGVWALSHAELTPVGLKPAPWRWSAGAIVRDVSQHLVYGLAVAGAYEALERRDERTRRGRRAIGALLAAGGAVGTIARRRQKSSRVPSFVRAPARTVRRVPTMLYPR